MKILLLQIFRRHLTPYTIIHLYSTAVCFRGAAPSLHRSVGETLRHRHESLMLRTALRNLCHVSLWRFSYTWIVSLLVVLHWLHKACKYFITSLVKNAWQLHQFPNESHELLSSLLLSTASIIDTLALLQPSKLCDNSPHHYLSRWPMVIRYLLWDCTPFHNKLSVTLGSLIK